MPVTLKRLLMTDKASVIDLHCHTTKLPHSLHGLRSVHPYGILMFETMPLENSHCL